VHGPLEDEELSCFEYFDRIPDYVDLEVSGADPRSVCLEAASRVRPRTLNRALPHLFPSAR